MAGRLERFERLVFGIVRWFFLGIALLAFLVLIISGINLISVLPSVFGPDVPSKIEVTYEEVKPIKPGQVKASGENRQTEQKAKKGEEVPGADAKRTSPSKTDTEIEKIIDLLKSRLGYMFPFIYNEQLLREVTKNFISKYPENIQNDFLRGLYQVIEKATDEELREVHIFNNYFKSFDDKFEKSRQELIIKKEKAKSELT